MLSWEQIEREAGAHFGGAELQQPWIRLPALDADGRPLTTLALRDTHLFDAEAVLITAFVCPASRMSMSMALSLSDRVDGALLVRQRDYLLRLVLPTVVLSWEVLELAFAHLVAGVRFVRREVNRADAILHDRLAHYCE